MANTNAPFGFLPVRRLSGKDIALRKVKKEASTIIGIGDPVVHTGSAEAGTGIALVDRAVGSEGTPGTITGIVVGIDPLRSDLTKQYYAAADTGYLLIAVADSDLVCEIQEDSVGGALAVTDVGQGFQMIVTNANTTTGRSKVMLDSSTGTTTTSSSQMMVLGKSQRPNYTIGNYCVFEVTFTRPTIDTQVLL